VINKGFFRLLGPFVVVAGVLALSASPGVAAIAIGQTATAGAKVDGVQVPSGTTLLSPARVETGTSPAVLHLSNGRVLAFSEATDAMVESVGGDVRLNVLSGNVAYTDGSGEVAFLSASNSLLLDQEGQIQEGARVSESASAEDTERLCELQDWSAELWQACTGPNRKEADCAWELLEVAASVAPTYVGKTAYLACKDRNPLDLTCDCRPPAAIWWKVGAGVGAAAGLYLLIDDDDEKSASPTTP
jgi:hypothetical protein